MANPTFSFSKHSRLKSNGQISALAKTGERLFQHPFLTLYHFKEGSGVRVAISVPKKHYKKAVDRNQVKRHVREAFRLNKVALESRAAELNLAIDILFVTLKTDAIDGEAIRGRIVLLLRLIAAKLASRA